MITIRQVTFADLERLQALSRQTFFEAFAQDNTPEDMQNYLDKSFNNQQLTQELKNPDSVFFFALSDQKEIGY